MKHLALGLLFFIACNALGQMIEQKEGLGKRVVKPSSVNMTAPATKAETTQVLVKMTGVIQKLIQKKGFKSGLVNGPGSATRDEVLTEFHRLFEFAQPSFRRQPTMLTVNTKRFKVIRKNFEIAKTLTEWNFVAPFGPLVSGSKPTLSRRQLGDAVGYFLTRLADLTHSPSHKFSPDLSGN